MSEQSHRKNDNRQRVLVTGAAGFLGRAVVNLLSQKGHEVIALTRRVVEIKGATEHVVLDLAQEESIIPLAEIMLRCDAVVHLAAKMTGGHIKMRKDVVQATEHLLLAHKSAASHARLILSSSIAVYDYEAYPVRHRFEEADRVDLYPMFRDAYAALKIEQEFLWRGYSKTARVPMIALRIGAIYNATEYVNSHLGWIRGSWLWKMGRGGVVPTVHVDDAARAIEATVSIKGAEDMLCFNIIEARPPRRKDVTRAWRSKGLFRWVVPVPLRVFAMLRWLPSFEEAVMSYTTLKARYAPYFFSIDKAQTVLNWEPRHTYLETLELSDDQRQEQARP